MREERELVFVYGALRRGAAHGWRMERGELVGNGRVGGRLFAIDWYPGVVLGGEGEVLGEVYGADERLRGELDEFEGIGKGGERGDEYARVRVGVGMEDGSEVEAWIYVYRWGVEGREEVVSGDWVGSGMGGDGER